MASIIADTTTACLANQEEAAAISRIIQAESNKYRTAFQTLMEVLKQRDDVIATLQGCLHIQAPSLSPAMSNTAPSQENLVATIFHSTQQNGMLRQDNLQFYKQQRDFHKKVFETLCLQIKERDQEILQLQQQLEEQTPSLPSLSPASLSPSGSPEPSLSSPEDEDRRRLESDVKIAKLDFLTAYEKDKVLQNLTFVYFMEIKNRKKEEISIENLAKDNPDLMEAAQMAHKNVTQKDGRFDEISTILNNVMRDKETLVRKLRGQANKKIDPDTLDGISQMIGQAVSEYADFYSTLRSGKTHRLPTKYNEFNFKTLTFCAAYLYVMRKRYEYFEKLLQKLKAKEQESLKWIRQVEKVQSLIAKLKRIQTIYSQLLNKCRTKN